MSTVLQRTLEHLELVQPEVVDDLLGEIGDRNRVRVTVGRPRQARELVFDSKTDPSNGIMKPGMLAKIDSMRIAYGLKGKYLPEFYKRCGAELVEVSHNLRVNVGIDYCAVQLGGAASATVAKNIALSNCTGTTAATDTSTTTGASGTGINWGTANATDAAAGTARGEYTALGVQRAAAAYAHTTSVTSFTQTKTFTASATVTSLQACGIFDSLTQGAGTLFCENTFTATSLANTDQLTIAWTFSL